MSRLTLLGIVALLGVVASGPVVSQEKAADKSELAPPPGKYQLCRRPGRMLDKQFFELPLKELNVLNVVIHRFFFRDQMLRPL